MVRGFVVLLAVLATTAEAQDRWIVVGQGQSAAEISVDSETIQRQGDFVTVWVRHRQLTDGDWRGGKQVAQILRRVEYSCTAMTAHGISMVEYAADGTPLSSTTDPQPSTPIVPDTVEEAVWRVVCPRP